MYFSFKQLISPQLANALIAVTTMACNACDRQKTTRPVQEDPAPQELLPPAGAPAPDEPDAIQEALPATDPWQSMAATCRKELERLQAIDQLGRSVQWRFQKIVRVSGPTPRVQVSGIFEGLPETLRENSTIDFLIDADFLRFTRDTTHCEYEKRPIVNSLRRRVQDVIADYATSFIEKRPTSVLNGLDEEIAYEADGVSIKLFVRYPGNTLEGCTEQLECLNGKIPELFGAQIDNGLTILVDNERFDKAEGLFHRPETYLVPARSENPSGDRESR